MPPSQIVPAAAGSTPLPPIGSQPLVSTEQQLVPNGYHEAQQQQESQNLPALLHSSIGKLHMNFVQNKSIEAENRAMIGYQPTNEERALELKKDHVPVPATKGVPAHLPNGQVNGAIPNGHANGAVVKVAMYGEFPLNNLPNNSSIQHQEQNKKLIPAPQHQIQQHK